jgi:hypothetical protein
METKYILFLVIVFSCASIGLSVSIGGGAFYYFSPEKKPSIAGNQTPSPSSGPSGKTPAPSPSGGPSGKTPSPSPSGGTSGGTPPKKKAKHILLKRVDGKDTSINVLEIKVVTQTKTLTKTDMTAVIEPQASPANEFGPQFLIDGSLEYKASDNTYTLPHTTESKSAYMKITLNKEEDIKEISVYNRQDCCKDRIIGTELQILASDNSVIFKASLDIASDVFIWDDSFIYK